MASATPVTLWWGHANAELLISCQGGARQGGETDPTWPGAEGLDVSS
jgi:hypothetical protein